MYVSYVLGTAIYIVYKRREEVSLGRFTLGQVDIISPGCQTLSNALVTSLRMFWLVKPEQLPRTLPLLLWLRLGKHGNHIVGD